MLKTEMTPEQKRALLEKVLRARQAATEGRPLSMQQQRLWFLDQMEPGNPAYNLTRAYRLRGGLDRDALQRALDEVVRRHEALRTRFEIRGNDPVQLVSPAAPVALAFDDLSASADADAALEAIVADESRHRYDLAAGPLFRARLVKVSADEHVLILSMHHVIGDGWSTGVLLREIGALYGAFAAGQESPLTALPMQYPEYAAWQRRRLQGEFLDAQLAYWRQRLDGAPAVLELPTDRARPMEQTFAGASETIAIPSDVMEPLKALAREEGSTLFMVLLGAFSVLLGRWSGQEDVVVGSPIAGRVREEVEPLIGFFVNTLALRTELGGDPTFRQLLHRVREATLGAFSHQEVPFERLVDELKVERTLSHSPVFQAMFALQNYEAQSLSLGGLQAERLALETEASKTDIGLYASEHAGGLACQLTYNPDLFHAATIQRMLEHFRTLLAGIGADPARRIGALELLGDEERGMVIDGWNQTARPFDATETVHAAIAAQARRTPDAEAVVFRDTRLTYAQLDARANQLAHHLRRLGAGPEQPVGICLERSAQTLVAMLAAMKAGAAYLPLDPANPADRLAYMLEDSGAPVLVTQASLRDVLAPAGVRTVCIDLDADAIAAEATDAPVTGVLPLNPAYVIYTSGSTGRPKGVQVTHANAASLFAGMDEVVGGPIPGTWLAVTRTSFDIHVVELLWSLARGFRVVVQPELDQARDDEGLAEQIVRHEVTHFQCTPSLAAMIVAESGAQALGPVHRVILGGEALPAELSAEILSVVQDGLVNGYGPTETTVYSVMHEVTETAGIVPIGRPVANTRVFVLDGELRPMPVGVPGELFITGAGVTRGYHNRPSLTAERFIPCPFSAEPGARMYRTGDRARWKTDGTVEYLGRNDFQVKIRGFRIELGEIESALKTHPAVREAAVIAREDVPGNPRLVAYVIPATSEEPEAELRGMLRDRLPDYMVPAAFCFLPTFPLTPSGKLDRRALPAPASKRDSQEAFVAPRGETERAVAEVWCAVLGVDQVGVEDNFFDLGGNSMLLARVAAELRTRLAREVRIVELFRHPTVAALAASLSAPAAAPAAAPERTAEIDRGKNRLFRRPAATR